MAVVVLGGTGFIGRAIVNKAGGDAIVIGSSTVDLREVNAVIERVAPIAKGGSLVFCAGCHRQRSDSFGTMLDNLRMVENVITAMHIGTPARVVYLSTVEVYGAPKYLPVSETTSVRPQHLYAIGKAACELLLQRFARATGTPLVVLRLPGIYGPNDGGTSVLGRLVGAAQGGEAFRLTGSGADLRDYVFVDDVADAALELSQRGPKDAVLNLATGISMSIQQIIGIVEDRFGPCRIDQEPSQSDHFDLVFDVSRLRRTLPAFSPRSIERGLEAWLI
jgi:UDP-glucose 4-epimerase